MSDLLQILQHSLGVDQYGLGEQYRSHFVSGPGHSDFETCLEAERDGLMLHYHNASVVGGHIFTVTDAGRAYVAEHSPEPPQRSAA